MKLGERFIEQLESPAKTGFGDIHKKYYSNSAIPKKIEKWNPIQLVKHYFSIFSGDARN